MSPMIQRYLIAAIFIVVIALGATIFLWQPQSSLPDAPRGGDFTLDGIDGPVSLSDFKGKAVVLYFGYTLCPDICPTSLALLSHGLRQLTPEQQRQIQPIFVTVDPERDGLEHLQRYGRYFHQSLIGLSGSPAEIKKTANLYGASYRRVESDSAVGYLIDHSAYLYLIDRQGKPAGQIAHGTPAKQIRDALLELIPHTNND